jgi:hypothetical protein
VNSFQSEKTNARVDCVAREDLPDPALAAVFALTGISLGQFYNGRPLHGLCWGAGGILLLFLIGENTLMVPAGFIFLAACATDAYSTAQEIGSRSIPFSGISQLFWLEVILVLSLATAFCMNRIFSILAVTGTTL